MTKALMISTNLPDQQAFADLPSEIIKEEILAYLSFPQLRLLLPTSDRILQDAFRIYTLEKHKSWKFYRFLELADDEHLFKICFELRSKIQRKNSSKPELHTEYDGILYNLITTFSYNAMRYYFLIHQGPFEYYLNFESDPDIAWMMSVRECYLLEHAVVTDLPLLRYTIQQSTKFISENLFWIVDECCDEYLDPERSNIQALMDVLQIITDAVGLIPEDKFPKIDPNILLMLNPYILHE